MQVLWRRPVSLKMLILFISEKNEAVQRFEATLQRSYPERLFALATKLYRRRFPMVRCNCDYTWSIWNQLVMCLLVSELQFHFDPDHPEAASVPATSAGFRHHLPLADSQLPNKQTPEVQGSEPPPCSRDPLRGFAKDHGPSLQTAQAHVWKRVQC